MTRHKPISARRIKHLKVGEAELRKFSLKASPKDIKDLNKLILDVNNKKLSSKKDSDGDGVVDSKDCEPFNPKKQGFFHDLNIKLLKRREEHLESKREKEMSKLEDTRDTLREKTDIADRKAEISDIQTARKQAVIDEIDREKSRIDSLKEANREAKSKLDDLTISGKLKKGLVKSSEGILESTKAFLQKDSTKATIDRIGDFIFDSTPRKRKKTPTVRRKKAFIVLKVIKGRITQKQITFNKPDAKKIKIAFGEGAIIVRG